MVFKNGVKNIQTADYNGTRTVFDQNVGFTLTADISFQVLCTWPQKELIFFIISTTINDALTKSQQILQCYFFLLSFIY